MNDVQPTAEVLLVDVETAMRMLSVKRTKLFELLKPENGTLQKVKIGRKTLITARSVKAVAERGAP